MTEMGIKQRCGRFLVCWNVLGFSLGVTGVALTSLSATAGTTIRFSEFSGPRLASVGGTGLMPSTRYEHSASMPDWPEGLTADFSGFQMQTDGLGADDEVSIFGAAGGTPATIEFWPAVTLSQLLVYNISGTDPGDGSYAVKGFVTGQAEPVFDFSHGAEYDDGFAEFFKEPDRVAPATPLNRIEFHQFNDIYLDNVTFDFLSATPEPSGAILGGMIATGLLRRRRRCTAG
jgi:hypothetical protein